VREWLLDPTSDARIPEATGPDVRWIVACSEGYASSLAAAALQEVGLPRATDLDGGFQAWRRAGLPVR
jgi:rhodanese-related sulfurtransferase